VAHTAKATKARQGRSSIGLTINGSAKFSFCLIPQALPDPEHQPE